MLHVIIYLAKFLIFMSQKHKQKTKISKIFQILSREMKYKLKLDFWTLILVYLIMIKQ